MRPVEAGQAWPGSAGLVAACQGMARRGTAGEPGDGVASTRVDASPARRRRPRKTMGETLNGVQAILRRQPARLAAGDGGLDEIAAMAHVRDLADQALDVMIVTLLAEGVSFAAIGEALGVTPQAVGRKYRGLSARAAGGQSWNQR